jgi:hypothetical protein
MPKRRADDYDFHSGHRRRKREDRKKRQLYILLAAAAVAAAVCTGVGAVVWSGVKHAVRAVRDADPDEVGPPDARLTAERLYGAYEKNEDQADDRYLSSSIQVDGVIANIERQPDSGWRVSLTSGPNHARVHAWFDAKQGDAIGRLVIGQKCSIVGVCGGKGPDTTRPGLWAVNLGPCRLAE